MGKNYYKILDIDKSASKEEIKKAYKKLAKKYHPDISKEADAETKFKEINEAAEVLLDDNKKQQYDTYGTADGPQGFSGFSGGSGGFNPSDFGINIDDIFEQFGFGGGFGGSSHSSSRKEEKDTSIYKEIEINLEDVYFGIEKKIKVEIEDKCPDCDGKGTKNPEDLKICPDCNGSGVVTQIQRTILGAIRTQRTCPNCHGKGKTISNPCSTCHGNGTKKKRKEITIKIPKGIENGVTLRVQGKGSYDSDTNTYGDLYLKIYVKNNKDYDVQGVDLYKNIDINFIQAIIGDEIEFKHFDKTLSLKIPTGTQPNTILRLKNKGLPYFNYNSQGDLYIKINVEIPKSTTKKQKEILLEYAKTLKDKGFMDRLKSIFK